jgi:hypothetical protein
MPHRATPIARGIRTRGQLRQSLSAPRPSSRVAPLWWTTCYLEDGCHFRGLAFASLLAAEALASVLLSRPRAYWISAGLFVAALIVSLDVGLAWSDVYGSHHAVVTSETIARKGIGKDYEPAFDQPLRDGAEFTILSENGEWIFGHFEGIGDGWLRSEAVVR